ncbi:hypothetical protein BDY24DRAFT_379802 [Mrakia frigida]|uniref:uncharacterized protein n=1 Tax=Mrakia frigida TaxID=29902 RepID=UPI003FCC25C1
MFLRTPLLFPLLAHQRPSSPTMLSFPSLLITLTSALAASAIVVPNTSPAPHVVSLLRRQSNTFNGAEVPQVCQPRCESTFPIYDRCIVADLEGCLRICEEGMLNEFYTCLNCLFVNEDAEEISETQYRTAVSQLDVITSACTARGYNFPPTIDLVDYDQLGSNLTSEGSPSSTSAAATGTSQAPAATSSAAVTEGSTGAASRAHQVGTGALFIGFASLAAFLL